MYWTNCVAVFNVSLQVKTQTLYGIHALRLYIFTQPEYHGSKIADKIPVATDLTKLDKKV